MLYTYITADRTYLSININKRRDKIDLVRWSVLSLPNTVHLPGDMCGPSITKSVGRGNTSTDSLLRSGLTSCTPRQQGLYRCSHTQDITGDQAL